MNGSDHDDTFPSPVDLTPMIDVTFLLIIFWMVVTSVAPQQQLRDMELPTANVRSPAGAGKPLQIEVTPDPLTPIYHAGRTWTVADFERSIAARPFAGRAVVIRADRRADAAVINRIARICHSGGAGKVAFSLRIAGGGG
jgi:biopolymer transport protein ExbD